MCLNILMNKIISCITLIFVLFLSIEYLQEEAYIFLIGLFNFKNSLS